MRYTTVLPATHRRGLVPAETGLLCAVLALLALALACLPQRAGALAVPLGAVIAWYGAAKLLELGDQAVFDATGQWVAGHSLKHLAAAGAAWPVLRALHSVTAKGHVPVMAGGHNGAPCPPGARSQH